MAGLAGPHSAQMAGRTAQSRRMMCPPTKTEMARRKPWTWRRTGMHSRSRVWLSACLVGVAMIQITASAAHATSIDFCGRLVASDAYCTGPHSQNYGTRWTYTSTTYTGGGSIDKLWAGMADVTYGNYSQFAVAFNATFVNGCWYKTTSSTNNNYGISIQHEASGASHTIYGHNDNSPNHTNCVPDYSL